MGLLNSKEKAVKQQAKSMKNNLYSRVNSFKTNNQRAFDQIDVETKRKVYEASALQIADMIDNQQITTLQVVFIFIERTINVGIQNNYVFDEMFEQAIAKAFSCDEQRKKDLYKKKCWKFGNNPEECYPPFYGVPTTMKQTLLIKGKQVHIGFVAKVNPLPVEDGLFTMMVKKMGFIPFVRSNVPQACKTLQTNNNIFGYSKNPWNKHRSCGGSSGGESGMIASYCAPIGFGSDIGGSLRIPSAFTGLVTLKMFNRYSRMGNCYYGQFTGGLPLKSELGPITRSVSDLIMVHQYMYDNANYNDIPAQFKDPYVKLFPFDWNIINSPQKFKIGVAKRLRTARSSQTNQRAIDMTVQILQQKGHQLVNIDLQQIQKLFFFLAHLFTFDQKLHLFSQFKGHQPLTIEYKFINLIRKIPWFIRMLLIWILKKKQPRLCQMIKVSKPNTAIGIFQKIYRIEKVLCPKICKIFAKNGLDALIMPSFVTPAPLLGEVGVFIFNAVWNILNFPVGVLPITVVKQGQTNFSDEFNDFYTKNIQKTLIGSQGMPVGIQVVSTPYNEQKILYLMTELQKQVKFNTNHHIPQ